MTCTVYRIKTYLLLTGMRSIRNFYLMQLGGKFDLRCGIQSRDPNFRVIWLKDGQLYSPQSNSISYYHGNSRILFDSLRAEDAGLYTCISGGNRYSTRLYMKRAIPPSMLLAQKRGHDLNMQY